MVIAVKMGIPIWKIARVSWDTAHLYENPPGLSFRKVANIIGFILIIELKFYNSLSLLSGAVAPSGGRTAVGSRGRSSVVLNNLPTKWGNTLFLFIQNTYTLWQRLK